MYQRDQAWIAQYGAQGHEQTQRVITFVLLTIQQSIMTVPDMMRDVDRQGENSPYLWGFKNLAYQHSLEHSEQFYEALYNSRSIGDPSIADRETLLMLANCKGMGIVKGGFALQLLYGRGGCIDSHNMDVFEVPAQRFKASTFKAAKPAKQAAMVEDYLELCEDIGGSEFLWDNWCGLVAAKNATTADHISRLHVQSFGEGG